MAELVPSQAIKSPSAAQTSQTDIPNNKNRKRRSRNKQGNGGQSNQNAQGRRRHNQKFAWRKHIQKGMVDPISLEPLVKLSYPPFALAITEPYIPIPKWPQLNNEAKERNKKQDEITRQAQILEEQWGSKISTSNNNQALNSSKSASKQEKITESLPKNNQKHVHLFDGKVLAAYLVSQLQFIDPLNRRDLTRDEIKNLDEYLERHRIQHASVLEAYDTRGITLNSAGVRGQTRSGRAEILQQEAQRILNSLFQHNTLSQNNHTDSNGNRRSRGRRFNRSGEHEERNQFASLYEAHDIIDGNDRDTNRNNSNARSNNREISHTSNVAEGIFNDGGMIIIDDNVNPGLRGVTIASDILNDLPQSHQSNLRHGDVHSDSFPNLAATSVKKQVANDSNYIKSNINGGKTSKTLLKIGKIIKKSDPKEIERQRKAREDALRKMELASLPFEQFLLRGDIKSNEEEVNQEMSSPVLSSSAKPSEKQLERNKILADALGVKPSTIRTSKHSLISGWKRPTNTTIGVDEFGKELSQVVYPDDLIIEARERLVELLKLEKTWISWLTDDTAASCSLKKMDRATRLFVHK